MAKIACSLSLLMTLASAQTPVPTLPPSETGFDKIALFIAWQADIYYLDAQNAEVLLADNAGNVRGRYGGWGDGADALDFPVDLAMSDNSVWVLDQGIPALVQLDPTLNRIATIALPDDSLPIAFARDSQQRSWVISDSRVGVSLIDDGGRHIAQIGDGLGSGLIQRPSHITIAADGMFIWDASSSVLVEVNLSGTIVERQNIELAGELLDIVSVGGGVILLTDQSLYRLRDRVLSPLFDNEANWHTMVPRDRSIYLMSRHRLDIIDLD